MESVMYSVANKAKNNGSFGPAVILGAIVILMVSASLLTVPSARAQFVCAEDPSTSGGVGTATGTGAVSCGTAAFAGGTSSVALGLGAIASADNAIAIGGDSAASGASATAIGANAQGLADNSVALGAGSAATDANTVSIGSDSLKRRIVNMEAGVDANDGVIVQQLNEGLAEANRYTDEAIRNIPAGLIPTSITKNFDRLESRANAAGALAMAMGAASNASVYTCTNFSWRECRGTVSVGVGHLDDEMAAAISYSRPLTRRSFFNINVGVADDEVGSSIGMGFNL